MSFSSPRKKRKISDVEGVWTSNDVLGQICDSKGKKSQATRFRTAFFKNRLPLPSPDPSAVVPSALHPRLILDPRLLHAATLAASESETSSLPPTGFSDCERLEALDLDDPAAADDSDNDDSEVEEEDELDEDESESEEAEEEDEEDQYLDAVAAEKGPVLLAAAKPKKRVAKANNTIPPSKRFKGFKEDHAMAAHERLFAQEGPPGVDDTCAVCQKLLPPSGPTDDEIHGRYRCEDCFRRPHLCRLCVSSMHRLNPFHRLLRWNPELGFWQRRSMIDLGYVMYTGHQGNKCPKNSRKPRRMVIVHANGVLTIPVHFCKCRGPAGESQEAEGEPRSQEAAAADSTSGHEEALQLIDVGLYPASWDAPQTAFTQDALRALILMSLQGNVSAQDYYTFLKRRTNNVAPESIPDRYREMMVSRREFDFLLACKRSAVDPLPKLPPRTLVVWCPACPHATKNMRPGWERRRHDLRYLDAVFYSIDGNFHSKQRAKPMDKNDVALTEGAAYFVDQADFERYRKKIGPEEQEESTCHKFVAMGYGGHRGLVTGIAALLCRHMMLIPAGIIDLKGAESQAYVDFAVVSGSQSFTSLRLIKLAYDIACQYMVHFLRRLRKMEPVVQRLPSVTTAKLPEVQGCVGKFHVNGHIVACRTFQSPNYLPGNGRVDGEGSEREWDLLNPSAKATQEMTPGHRHDSLNSISSDLNVRQLHKMPQTLSKDHAKAEKWRRESGRYLRFVERKIPLDVIAQWKEEEADWLRQVVDIKNHKDMANPYVASGPEALSAEATVSFLRSEHSVRGDIDGFEMVGTIQRMIDLETEKTDLIAAIGRVDRSKKRQRGAITTKVEKIYKEAGLAREEYERHVTSKVVEAHNAAKKRLPDQASQLLWRNEDDDRACELPRPPKVPDVDPLDDQYLDALIRQVEDVSIFLPSSYHSVIRRHPAMAAAVAIERKLREGQANDALNNLRTHIAARYSLRDLRHSAPGPKHGKEVRALARGEQKIGDSAKYEYRRVRVLLRVLGMSEDDEIYQPLREEDVTHFVVVEEQYNLGDGTVQESWLWRDFSFIHLQDNEEVTEFLLQKTKPHWFRSRAKYARWAEEVHLKREEMYRTKAMFQYEREVWQGRARSETSNGRLARAAYACKQAYRYTMLLEKARESFPADIDIALGIPKEVRADLETTE